MTAQEGTIARSEVKNSAAQHAPAIAYLENRGAPPLGGAVRLAAESAADPRNQLTAPATCRSRIVEGPACPVEPWLTWIDEPASARDNSPSAIDSTSTRISLAR